MRESEKNDSLSTYQICVVSDKKGQLRALSTKYNQLGFLGALELMRDKDNQTRVNRLFGDPYVPVVTGPQNPVSGHDSSRSFLVQRL